MKPNRLLFFFGLGREKQSNGRSVWVWGIAALTVLIVAFALANSWYASQMEPADAGDTKELLVKSNLA